MDLSNSPTRLSWSGARERLWLAWEASDPDWLRLTQSLKTVLAVVLTMGIVYPVLAEDVFVSAIGAGFLMQCGEGATRRRQQLTMTVCGLALVLLAALGAAVSAHREAREALIIVVAFFTFYARRFVPRRPGFTAYAFVVCLLSTVLPGGASAAISHAEVLGIASGVAFLVFFYIRPPNPVRAFAAGTQIFCTSAANYLRTLGPECDLALSAKHQHLVKRVLRFNQALADSLDDGTNSLTIDELLMNQYDVWQTLEMLQDSLCRLAPTDFEKMHEVQTALHEALFAIATSFDEAAARMSDTSPSTRNTNALEAEVLRSSAEPTRAWVYLGGVILAGRRLEAQARLLAERLRPRAGASP
jgi:hypothetical protein